MSRIIRLVDRAPGYSVESQKELGEWLAAWGQHFADGKPGQIASVVVVVEGANGNVGIITQSHLPLDRARTAGLLSFALARHMAGLTGLEEIEE